MKQTTKLTIRSQEGYVPPKKPYSFEAMLDDILHFAAVTLVDNGRLSMWMPTANDEDIELAIPNHSCLEVVSICVQPFNKCKTMQSAQESNGITIQLGSRRLLTYRRLPGVEVPEQSQAVKHSYSGNNADDLNAFRRKVITAAASLKLSNC